MSRARAPTAPTCWRSSTESSPRPVPGEQVEAFVSRGGDTEVRVYEGEVEHFVSAQARGHRHPRHPRRPHRLRLRRHARRGGDRRGVGRGARQRHSSARSTSGPASPSPTASPSTEQDALERRAGGVPDRAQDRPRQGARAADARAPTRASGSTTPTTPTPSGEAAVATTTGIRQCGPRERLLRQRVDARRRRRRDADRLRLQRRALARRVRPRVAAREAADRATRLLGRDQAAVERTTVVFDPFVTAQLLGIISSTLNGEAVVKGRSLFKDRLGDQVAPPFVSARRRSDQSARLHRDRRRRRGPRRPPQRL